MDLLTQTFERVTYSWITEENGEKNYCFKIINLKIQIGDSTIIYSISRSNRKGIDHMIDRTKKGEIYSNETRYKMYDNDKSFENAIKRIERMAKNQTL
jgi:predicted DNA-binding transcriptional regulator